MGFDGNRPRADLDTFPPEVARLHHKPMLPPIAKIRACGIKYLSERSVPVVARAAEHGIIAVDLAGKEDPVPVVRKKCILQPVEGLEIARPSQSDCRAVILGAPGDVILLPDATNPRVIAVG